MCGLVGYVAAPPAAPTSAATHRALAALRHRGPNDEGLEHLAVAESELCLGHTRLSIIDLSAGGHQPMRSADGRYVLVFNGEIYNYRELRRELEEQGRQFRSASDTEVLLAAWERWGEDCLPRLTGMFAFAVADLTEATLTLARDAFGIKPLFYAREAQRTSFASELPALLPLLQQAPAPNLQRAWDYLAHGLYDHTPETFFAGVQQLPPGHALTLPLQGAAGAAPRRWWWPAIDERPTVSLESAAEELRTRFLDSVRLHLRSDVPLGAALSGGVDSSAVVCAMRHLDAETPIHTFTFVAPGSATDEAHWAERVNHHVGATAHAVQIAPGDLARDLDDLIRTQGEPFGSTSIYAQYRVFQAAREAGIVVTLDGQGADELLAGYSGYPLAATRSLFERRDWTALAAFWRHWPRWPGRSRGDAAQVLAALLVPDTAYRGARRLAGAEQRHRWLQERQAREVDISPGSAYRRSADGDARGRRLAETLREQLSGRGLGALLRHGDRNSMRWSVESRVPFLTTELAEFALGLPENYLLSREGETKHVLRRALRGIVPDPLLERRDKIGFETPQLRWLRDSGLDADELAPAAACLPFLDQGTAARALRDGLQDRNGAPDAALWRLVNYCRWAQLHNMRGAGG